MTKPLISETICPLLSTQKVFVKCLKYECAVFNRKVLMCGFAFVPLKDQKESAEDYHIREV